MLKLEEKLISECSHQIAIDGHVIGCESAENDLAEMMVGRAVKFEIDKKPANPGKDVLSLENISIKNSIV